MKVRVNNEIYKASHGKDPRGYGRWAFEIDGRETFITGTYKDARNKAIKMTKIVSPTTYEIKVLP